MQEHRTTRAASGKAFRCLMCNRDRWVILDEEDYAFFSAWKWSALPRGYAMRSNSGGLTVADAGRRTVYLHRLVAERMGLRTRGGLVDHINRRTVDDRRANLRVADRSQNQRNQERWSRAYGLPTEPIELDPISPNELSVALGIARSVANAVPAFGPIALTNGGEALVSPEDHEVVVRLCWRLSKSGYAFRQPRRPSGGPIVTWMHRVIAERMGIINDGPEIDHINGIRLDNRRENLRAATRQQQSWNTPGHKDGTSRFKGVSWSTEARRTKRWVAQIYVDGRNRCLGRFSTEEEAAEAYRKAAVLIQGEFARF